ncbi:cob(I)yrinic acid a,c-diamide adenosyltransferase [Jeotgalibacillus sp. S-D1]|uniref:cob(I)yrinic acid a,c-diamide adenosyltransferase n=1 Tax=Jeotgalibacillus sp. S-D1 TaxID=2552189 RepID=UPI00105A241B|nr:cob(I)yrinic acid a,c-diamide adenosyltransferase [Jeotgalibacillus sp. S-D1]TDL32971.1 cob(I)yrinic acid a,c-diamide adenosyltransferase [Jeotgalibacillus sp. S-D1]
MRIYTRTGDKGQTSLIGGRVDKDDVRVEAYGTIDEVNSFVGRAVTELDAGLFPDVLEDLESIQHELFDAGGDLANVSSRREWKLDPKAIEQLETRIDQLMEEAPDLERFVLPGGSSASASLHIARTITRRAERQVVSLAKLDPNLPAAPQQYLNRLSDYFFACARAVNAREGIADVEYVRSAKVFRTGKRAPKAEE